MPFEIAVGDELIRVTGHMQKGLSALLKGVPVRQDQQLKSATYSVQVWAELDSLPVVPAVGQIWRVEGGYEKRSFTEGKFVHWLHHYQSPRSLEFTMPNDGETFTRFVASDKEFKGIGESKARQLWDRFGTSIHDMLQAEGATHLDALREILSDNSIKALYAGYKKYQNLKHTLWMSKAGISGAIQRRVLKHHREATVNALKANPYELANFGMKIADIDQLLTKGSDAWCQRSYPTERMQMAAILCLNELLAGGSTYAKPSMVETKIRGVLKNHEQASRAIQYLKNTPSVAIYHEGEDRLHPVSTAIQELAVAKRIKYLSGDIRALSDGDLAILNEHLAKLDYELTEKQLEAVKMGLTHQVSCITGGAGTGKTTVLSTLLKTAFDIGYDIYAVALSGRAAMRLHESVGFITSTIARFLQEDPVVCINSEDKQLLVIDESSMIDLQTMFRIINQVCPNTKIVFTGDPNQLPPIGKGKILHDLVESDVVATTTLDIVKRQKGDTGIPLYSKQINDGEVPGNLNYGNVFFYESADDNLIQTALNLYSIAPDDSRMIAPTREITSALNKDVQEKHNSRSKLMQFSLGAEDCYLPFRLHDQVLFTKNHYQIGVQNGSLGELTSVEQDGERFGMVRLDNGESIPITQSLLDCMQLGYAITLHKAQGSQFPRVIVVLKDSRVIDRSWLYTAITRAETEVHIVGSSGLLRKITQAQPTAFKRKTMMTGLLSYIDPEEPVGFSPSHQSTVISL